MLVVRFVGRTAVALALSVGLVCGLSATDAIADQSAAWSGTRVLLDPSVQTFSPDLAVNGAGDALAAWFAGPAPPTASSGRAGPAGTWRGNEIMVAIGSVMSGFQPPVPVAENGTDVEGEVTVAVSRSAVDYVAWRPAGGAGQMVVAGRHGRLSRPEALRLPPGAVYERLANDGHGQVDAFWHRGSGRRVQFFGRPDQFFCTRLSDSGRSLRTVVAPHPKSASPCGAGTSTNPTIPEQLLQPDGFQLAGYSVTSRSDDHGNAIAIWDDWPTSGPAWTYGLFYSIKHR
jgi:hypothetical protein